VIDGGVLVADIGAGVRRMIGGLRLHRLDHGNEGRLPMMDGEKDLLVVVAGIAGAFDEQEAELAGVGANRQVRAPEPAWV
jgi:hypothetical protein